MATFDAASHPAATGNAVSTLSWTHTPVSVPSGVIVCVTSRISGGTATLPTVTYGGIAMTQLGTQQGGSTGTDARCTAFFLASPPSGAQTVAVAFGGTNQGSANALAVTATSSAGTALFASASIQTNIAISVTPAGSDLSVMISGSTTAGAGWASDGAGQTNRLTDNSGSALDIEGSTGQVATMTATLTAATTGNNVACVGTFQSASRPTQIAVIYMRKNR